MKSAEKAEQPKAEGGDIPDECVHALCRMLYSRFGSLWRGSKKNTDFDDAKSMLQGALSAAPQPEPVRQQFPQALDTVELIVGEPDHTVLTVTTTAGELRRMRALLQPEQPARDDDYWTCGCGDQNHPNESCRICGRSQPPQQADAEMQPAQCPQCLYAFAMPATTKQADGGAVLWVSQGSFDWIKEIGGSGYILAFGHPFDDGKHIPLYAAHPPNSPGVVVDEVMSRLDKVADYAGHIEDGDTVVIPLSAIRAALLAALGGEK